MARGYRKPDPRPPRFLVAGIPSPWSNTTESQRVEERAMRAPEADAAKARYYRLRRARIGGASAD
ncbi:hypothetical protein [Hydrogenophaga sp.]|uniref:hypothetical protein n=1 Tax=Hydrogenophaga sp. TaxID=1904254 RepID=UPI00263507CE|nr:hypothetical protein [Hydrogenophaga sp.]MCW5652437.1 hypothetical protein [Hydrogenophaga sp.]